MSKLDMNPDFEGDEGGEGGGNALKVEGNQRKVDVDEELLEDQEGDEEEKETEDEESEEEDDQSDASTDEESGDESSDGDDEDADADATQKEKERELAGLDKEEDKIDEDIRTTKERIVNKRTERRQARKDLKEAEKLEAPTEEKIDLSDMSEEEIKNIEKVLQARGYAPKAQIQAESFKLIQKDLEDDFIEKNPQYKPENDKNDILYDALYKEVGMFAKPTSPAQITAILKRAHTEVQRKYPSRFPKPKPKNADGDAAARAKINLAGTGSRDSGPSGSKKADVYGPKLGKKGGQGGKLTEAQKAHFRTSGWSEEDIADMDKD